MPKKRVVLTGAGGIIAGLLIDELRQRYDLLPLDVKETDREGRPIDGVVIADLLNRDISQLRSALKGADAVVHAARIPSPWPHTDFWVELNNVIMAYNVYQACEEEGVRRAVMISTNHAADFYERSLIEGGMDMATPEMRPFSHNFYGWARAAYELIGFVFASGGADRKRPILEVVQLRVGAPRETDLNRVKPGELLRMRRALGAYISQRDLVQLAVKSIETGDIHNELGVPFQVFYGVSGNFANFWSIANARRVVGYEPQDIAEARFADKIAEIVAPLRKLE